MNDILSQTKSTAGSTFSQFLQDLRDGKSLTISLTDALTGVENKLFDIVSNQAVSALFKSGTSAFSSLFTPAAPGAPLNILPTNHSGYGPGDLQTTFRAISGSMSGWVRHHDGIGPGEHGAVIRNDESVLTPGQMKQLAPAASSRSAAAERAGKYKQLQRPRRTAIETLRF